MSLVSLTLILAVLALGISVITAAGCAAALIRRDPPDVAELRQRLLALDQEVTDLNDRVGQWMRRESVRRMRAGKEETQLGSVSSARLTKAELRRKMFGHGVSDESV